MEIRNIISFLKIAELGSFSKTAEELGYSQSNITMQIQQLERELDTKLFDRIGKTVSLTEDGKKFKIYALTITKAVDNAKHVLSHADKPEGELRIGLLESLCITYLPHLIHVYHDMFPEVSTIIKIGTYDELAKLLSSNEIDLLWTFSTPMECSEWVKVYEYTNPLKIVANVNHTLIQRKHLHLSDLSQYPFILTEKTCSYRTLFEQEMQKKDLLINIFLEIGNTEIIKKFVHSGLALSVLPYFAVEQEEKSGQLSCLEIEDFQLTMYGQFFYHKDKWVTPAMNEFIDLIRKIVK